MRLLHYHPGVLPRQVRRCHYLRRRNQLRHCASAGYYLPLHPHSYPQQVISFSLIIVRVGIELSQRPYLPTSLPRRSSHRGGRHALHPFSPSLPSFPTTPEFDASEFDSTPDSPSGYESRETLPAFAMNVRLPGKGGVHARASGEDVPRDAFGVKAGG